MAKALKIAAIGLAVAGLAITGVGLGAGLSLATATTFGVAGVSASALFVASGALSLAAGALQKTPSIPSSQEDRLTATINPRAPRATVYGQTAMATDVRYEEWSGADQDYCDWIIALASHRIDGVEEIWLNTELAWSASRGVTSKFAGYFSVPNIVLEGSPANAFTFASGKWNGRLTGCAYLRARFKVTGNGKKATSPFSSGVPTRITIIGRGMRLYDPRRDSTVPGGNGPMRADDQSTWRYTADDGAVIGENLALHALADTLGWRIRNPSTGEMKLAVGSGVPPRRLNLASWIEAANLADEAVNRSAGGTEPRYHGAVVLSEAMSPKERLDTLCVACNGRFRDTGGKLSFVISHNDLASAALDDGLLDDDVVGPFTWNPDAALDAVPNVVRGKYVDATTASLYQMLDYPDVRLPSLDGQDREFTLDLAAVESPSQAQRIAKQVLQRKQYQREFTAPFDIRAWKYGVGDIVPFTFAPLSFERKLFRVKEQEIGQGGVCNMTLTVESPDIYAWDRDDSAPVQPAEANAYDASKNPLILAIDDAATTAHWSAVADDDGKRPDDNATVGAPPGTKVGDRPVELVLEKIDQIEPIKLQFGPITSDISALQEAKVGFDNAIDILGRDLGAAALGISALQLAGVKSSAALEALSGVVVDQDVAQKQASAAAGRLEEAVLRAVLESARTRDVIRDAGIIVNPADGTVRIYAIDQLRDRTSLAEIAIDGVKGLVTTKASVNYVDEQLALAVLNPEQVAQLEPILARLTQAETQIDGLNAAIRLKASVEEMTALAVRTRAAEIDVDALKGQIALTATADAVDKLLLRTSSIEQRLVALPDTAGLIVEVRQARAAAQNTEDALLRSLAAGDIASRYQLTQIAQARQELSTRMDDGFSAAAVARTQLAVQIDRVQATMLSEALASVTRDTALTQRIDAQGVTLDSQAAAIGRLDRAAIDATGGIASTQMTIRQIAAAAGDTGEALLRSIAAGETAGQARAAQLVQIQTEFSTTLVAGQKSEASAREALLARMAQAEAAIVTTSKVLADTTGAYGNRITALEVAIADPVTGQAATRVRINSVEDASVKRDGALGSRIDGIEAVVNDQVTGLPATRAALTAGLKAAADRTQALSEQFVSLTAELHDPVTGLAATYANLVQASRAQVDGDKALAELINAQGVTLGDQAAAIGRLDRALLDAAGGIAGTQMTIRQMVGVADSGGEAMLRALAAGEQEGQARAAQLVQIQTEFSTTLVAGQKSEASAREALLARMAQAEAAIVTTSKTVSDLNQALANRIVALEAVFSDAATGLLATRARIVALEDATAKADAAAAQRLDFLETTLNDPSTGLPATRATIAQDRAASVDRDAANARDIQQLSGQVNDPTTGLPATVAGLAQERTVSAERDAARAREIQVLSGQLNDPTTGLPAVGATVASNKQAQVDGDKALGESLQQVTTTLNGQTASINLLLRTIDGKEAVAQLTVDVDGKISGFRVNGKDSTFAIAANKFIVGASQIFEVDATTGVTRIRNAVIGTATIDTLNIRGGALSSTKTDIQSVNGVSASAAQSSDTTTFDATGGTIRIDVCVQPTRTATGAGALRVQLFSSDGRALSGQYKCPSATDSAPVTFMAIDSPAAGSRGYYVAYSVDSGNGAAAYNATHLMVLTELKR